MGDKKDKDDNEDPRLEWIFNYLTKTLKLRQEKWNKMIGTDEYIVSTHQNLFCLKPRHLRLTCQFPWSSGVGTGLQTLLLRHWRDQAKKEKTIPNNSCKNPFLVKAFRPR